MRALVASNYETHQIVTDAQPYWRGIR
jgi:hypothetical protein